MRRSAQQCARLVGASASYASAPTNPLVTSSTRSLFTPSFSSLPAITTISHSLHTSQQPPHQPRAFHTASRSCTSSFHLSPLSAPLSRSLTHISSTFNASTSSSFVSTPASASLSASSTPSRSFVTSRPLLGFEEFFTNQQAGRTGRMWRCSDLRVKSFDDLQKLWFVLLKERNMLLTYRHQCTVTASRMANPERLQKVKKSMAHIKMVMGERYREVRERTEEPDSEWRKTREEKRAKRALIAKQVNRQKALPKQVHRQKERHPQRKKIKFRGLRPRTTTEGEQQSAVTPGEPVGQAQSAA